MSEPPPRGAERDIFRDTWVRYLGERGPGVREGLGDPSPCGWRGRGRQTLVRGLEKVEGS